MDALSLRLELFIEYFWQAKRNHVKEVTEVVVAASQRYKVAKTKANTASTVPVSKLVVNAGLSLLNTDGANAKINRI